MPLLISLFGSLLPRSLPKTPFPCPPRRLALGMHAFTGPSPAVHPPCLAAGAGGSPSGVRYNPKTLLRFCVYEETINQFRVYSRAFPTRRRKRSRGSAVRPKRTAKLNTISLITPHSVKTC